MVLEKSELTVKSTDVHGPPRDSRGETTICAMLNACTPMSTSVPDQEGHVDEYPRLNHRRRSERPKPLRRLKAQVPPEDSRRGLAVAGTLRPGTSESAKFPMGKILVMIDMNVPLVDSRWLPRARRKSILSWTDIEFDPEWIRCCGFRDSSCENCRYLGEYIDFSWLSIAVASGAYSDTTKMDARVIWTGECDQMEPQILVYHHCPLFSKLFRMFVLCDIHRTELRIKDWQNAHGKVGIQDRQGRYSIAEPDTLPFCHQIMVY